MLGPLPEIGIERLSERIAGLIAIARSVKGGFRQGLQCAGQRAVQAAMHGEVVCESTNRRRMGMGVGNRLW